jgi:hypothetical protein
VHRSGLALLPSRAKQASQQHCQSGHDTTPNSASLSPMSKSRRTLDAHEDAATPGDEEEEEAITTKNATAAAAAAQDARDDGDILVIILACPRAVGRRNNVKQITVARIALLADGRG